MFSFIDNSCDGNDDNDDENDNNNDDDDDDDDDDDVCKMRVHKFHPVASSAAQRGESSNFRSKIIIIIIFIFKMVMNMIMICKREFPKLDFRICQFFLFLGKVPQKWGLRK